YAVSEATGLVAVRYPRGCQSEVLAAIPSSEGFGPRVIREGENIAILSLGIMAEQALEAAKVLSEKGIEARVIDVRCVKPVDISAWKELLSDIDRVVTIEDGIAHAGFGSYLLSALEEEGGFKCVSDFTILGVSDHPLEAGDRKVLLANEGMDSKSIVDAVFKNWI
ncbi:MAG: hypothetical protein IKX04_09275, partial [Clostridiales bacterium]|nr:hypothetical protein [Clostridiales bacterium]